MQKKEVRHMIYTVTFNPCLDYIVGVEDFQLGMTNRTCSEQMFAGGKGINVSIVLKNLGIESTALGFIAGFTGEEIRRKVEKMGITSEFIQLENGFSRINIKLKSIDGTEINGTGPSIGSEELERLLKKLDTLKKGDVLAVAQVAGIQAAKHNWELIPMCHPLPLTGIDITFRLSDEPCMVEIQAAVTCTGVTGVEMEALTAVSVAALTVYDMCKAVQKDMEITNIRLLEKSGGKSGDYKRED